MVSEMQLWIYSYASYLSDLKACSRVGGYFFLSKKPNHPIDSASPTILDNGPTLVTCTLIDAIMASEMEVDISAAFIKTKVSPLPQLFTNLDTYKAPFFFK